jgi:hypothetical protein
MPLLVTTFLPAQDPTAEERLKKFEEEHQQLMEQLGILGEEVERSLFQEVIPPVGESSFGLGPAASKVYGVESGISLGGYGEFLFEQRSGDTERFDALRVVTYVGYKFNPNWLFNSEIEIEHGTTSASSGTTSGEGYLSAEFAYIDYLHSEALNARGGLVLTPMGLINDMHEPWRGGSDPAGWVPRPWGEKRGSWIQEGGSSWAIWHFLPRCFLPK